MWTSVVLCVCLVPLVLAKRTAMSRHQQELKEHYDHLAKIAEFECDQPQPRLLTVHELMSDFQTRGKAYFPEVTVLHRCDRHVGSCNDASYQCGPTHATEVKMPFKVTFLEDMAGHSKGQWEMEYHTMSNHTACGCLKYDIPPPSKTAVHYHYVDPALVPPSSYLPLEPATQVQGSATSYQVPVYQNNTQSKEPQPGENSTGPSIYEMTKMAEEEVKPIPNEEVPEVKPIPDEEAPEVKPIPDEEVPEVKPIPNEEVKTEEDIQCLSCTESHYLEYFPGYSPSEAPTGDRSSTPEVRPSEVPPEAPSHEADADSTTIPSELIRFGSDDGPRNEALKQSDNPYDSFLRQASS